MTARSTVGPTSRTREREGRKRNTYLPIQTRRHLRYHTTSLLSTVPLRVAEVFAHWKNDQRSSRKHGRAHFLKLNHQARICWTTAVTHADRAARQQSPNALDARAR